MRLQLPTCLLVAVGCMFAFSSQAQAQCSSCNQAAGVAVGQTFAQEAPMYAQGAPMYTQQAQMYAAPAATGCGCKKGCGIKKGCGAKKGCGGCRGGGVDGCKPTGPTVAGELPVLPIRTACDSPWGIGNVPSLLTPPRSYTPPIGKDVGRPLLGRWTGF